MDRNFPNGPFPPGWRFAPTKEELAVFYLKRKVLGRSLPWDFIPEVDIYLYVPQDLPHFVRAIVRKELVWYFFCRPRKRFHTGSRKCRATEVGYWKPTGDPRVIRYENRPVANIKTLVFYEGKSPDGIRTDWVMHEYCLADQELADRGIVQDTFVLCKIFRKPQHGPQNGAEYGAPFIENDWDNLLDAQEEAHPGHSIEAPVDADEQNNFALANACIPEIAVSLENNSVIYHTGLVSSASAFSSDPSSFEHVSITAVSCVTGHTGPASSALSFDPPGFEKVGARPVSGVTVTDVTTSLASSALASSSHGPTSKQVCPRASAAGVSDHNGMASSAPASSSHPFAFEQGGINQTSDPVSNVDFAFNPAYLMEDLDSDEKGCSYPTNNDSFEFEYLRDGLFLYEVAEEAYKIDTPSTQK